ncbi:sarcoplasmic reticulum histidine-rich calcium-binding protein [Amyelois transitella]|uniref:sarcoplasmic reticulum histidine-rich calcium-binding protein n=1 Tax=Amyelois transitella TaxID=680683 RepID=UPI00298FA64D|nr:sarcoplasmic reticulum histidine-rich calcium-binding protein [Amyelois transitella]
MVKLALGALAIAAAASAVQVNPAATSYIYRSDNGGPASLIQLGAHGYPALPLPAPIVEPLKPIEAYAIGPVPLPYVAAKPIVVVDEEGDDSEEDYEDSAEGLDHGHAYEKGGGSNYGEEYHKAHGEKGSKGYKSNGHHAKGASGHYGKEHKEGYYNENEGDKGLKYDKADSHGKHYESGESYKGGDHGHKKHFSKGEEVTGYHKVFNKDEFKKDHDFYDVADNSGHFNKHGYEKKHHDAEEGGHKEGGHQKGGFDKGEFGKGGSYAEGDVDDAENNHSAEEEHESHYGKGEEYGKKGGSGHEKEYAYDDDDEEEDY